MKKGFSVGIILIAIVVIGYFVFVPNKEVTEKDVIKIGAILPLTGDVAVYGNNTKKGIDLAVREVNKNGGINGKKIEILYEDSKALPKEGVSAIQKLISKNKIQYVIDNSVSSVALAMVPLVDKNKVVLLSTGSTNPKLSGISKWFFRIWNSDAFEGKFTAQFISDTLGLKKIGIIYVFNDYGISLKDVFKKEIIKKGGKITVDESFKQNENDFKIQLTKIKNKNPQVIYIVGYSKEISNILLQIESLKIKSKLVGSVTMEDRQIIEIAGSSANGVIYPFPAEPDTTKLSVAKFQKSYFNEYNELHGITSDVGYDAVQLFAKAVEVGDGFSSENIRIGLMKIKNYYGASGLIEFDDNGDVSKPMIFKTIKNKKYVDFKNE